MGLPSGVATFMFSDIEGSTRLWESDPSGMRRSFAEAMVGRLSMQANETMLLLAALADAEGDQELAIELLLEVGPGRSPITIKYGEELAQRLRVGDAYAAQQRGNAQ